MLLEVFHSGRWGGLNGDKVEQFAERFTAFQGARLGASVPNSTLALELALRALGIGPGDEVLTSPYTSLQGLLPNSGIGLAAQLVRYARGRERRSSELGRWDSGR